MALILAISFVTLFIWATRSGQYDDLETPAKRMLFDDNHISKKKKNLNCELTKGLRDE